MILSLEHSVPERYRSSFKRIFIKTIIAVTLLYIAFGVCGYLTFGEETEDVITLNLDHESGDGFTLSLFVKILLCCSLYLTYPLMMFPVTNIVKKRVKMYFGLDSDTNIYIAYAIRLFLVTCTGVVIMKTPKFYIVMAFIGAICCTNLAFTIPALCHLKLFKDNLTER